MNQVALYGNITKDPVLKEVTHSDKKTHVTNFNVAVSRRFRKSDGELETETDFIPCEAWHTGAETICNMFKKGDPILISGAVKTENWEKDGQHHTKVKIRVNSFHKLHRPGGNNEDGE